MNEIDETFYCDKEISIEPDLGDLRKSTDKALPAPPKTPKRVLMKYRFSAIFSIAFAVTGFLLTLVLILAGGDAHTFGGQYLVALNTSAVGKTSTQQEAVSVSASSGVNDTGMARVYYLYVQGVCTGSPANSEGSASNIIVENCETYAEANARLTMLKSSAEAVPENLTSPLSLVARSLNILSTTLASVRIAVFASLIVSLVGSALSAISAIPAIFFPHSRLLAYFNIFWPLLASNFAFLASTLLTVLIAGVFVAVGRVVDVADVEVQQGASVLLLAWLAWLLTSLSLVYWGLVWFVEVRRSSFIKRKRGEDEVGNWRGIGKEMWRDVKGRKAV